MSARAQLKCPVIGITGSTGKTSTKDILGAILGAQGKTFTSAGNRNTEIGMPLELLKVHEDTTAVVLEMAMRAEGEIAELVAIAKPDAGLIVNIGPVHLETLGSIERVAAAKSELITGLAEGKVAVTPAGDALLQPYLRSDLDSITFGPSGDCRLVAAEGRQLTIAFRGEEHRIEVDFDQPHNRQKLVLHWGLASLCLLVFRSNFRAFEGNERPLRTVWLSSTTATTQTQCLCVPRSPIWPESRIAEEGAGLPYLATCANLAPTAQPFIANLVLMPRPLMLTY
jgi:hypothetical protein